MPKRRGRPRLYDPARAARRAHRAIWIDATKSERERLKLIEQAHGEPVSRQILHARYGGPRRPRPEN